MRACHPDSRQQQCPDFQHSPLASTPSWLTAMQFTIACAAGAVCKTAQLGHCAGNKRNLRGSVAALARLTRCCCRKLCRKSPCGSLNFLRLSAAPAA